MATWASSQGAYPVNWGKPLFSSTQHSLDCLRILCSGFGAPQFRRGPTSWCVPGKLALWEKTEKMRLVQPGEEVALGNIAAASSYLWGGYHDDWGRLFCWDGVRPFFEGGVLAYLRENKMFTVKVISHCKKMSGQAVGSWFLNVLMSQLDRTLNNLVWV